MLKGANEELPERIVVNGTMHKLTVFAVITRFLDGTPALISRIRDEQPVVLNSEVTYMTAYVPELFTQPYNSEDN